MGGLSSGHYVCYSKHENGTWYEYNDSSCSVVEKPEDAISKYGYILFFRRSTEKNYPFLDEYISKYLQDLEKEKENAAKEAEKEKEKTDSQMTSPQPTDPAQSQAPGATAPKEERKDVGSSKQ
jgi:hypothetical protein